MLVTGPTGSGKSTSLYALLKQLKNSTNTVLTCEDPIEYEIEGVGQSQINEKAGVGFSNLLRAALRQDPDIIMVGEIRDADTAQTAIRAALTGHLVLSTLHCNNAVAAIPRLLDIGVDPYLLSTCLVGVTAQRLIRTFNPDDRIEDNHLAHRKVLASIFPDYNVKDPIYTTLSMHEGYGRREAVHEVLPITPEVSKQIAANSDLESIRQAGIESGYEEMYLQALTKVREGATSVPEVMRMVSIPADHTRELTIERMAA
jgi:type IV pilus assembly protein PilB